MRPLREGWQIIRSGDPAARLPLPASCRRRIIPMGPPVHQASEPQRPSTSPWLRPRPQSCIGRASTLNPLGCTICTAPRMQPALEAGPLIDNLDRSSSTALEQPQTEMRPVAERDRSSDRALELQANGESAGERRFRPTLTHKLEMAKPTPCRRALFGSRSARRSVPKRWCDRKHSDRVGEAP